MFKYYKEKALKILRKKALMTFVWWYAGWWWQSI